MLRAILDRAEDALELRRVGTLDGLPARVRERGDRRERVVELVRDHADDLLPGLHFLARQLARQLLQQVQAMRLAVEQEAALREVIDLGLALAFDREQRVGFAATACRNGSGDAASSSANARPSSLRPPRNVWRAATLL